jgi:hypothetical protein
MAFFARPNIDDTQFKQLTGSTLHLSGQTHIMTPSGLSLTANDGINNIVVTAKGADFTKNGYVLTYNDSKKQIELCLSAGSGGTQIYNGTSPTTCTVGGLCSGTSISGETLSCIIQQIVAPALNPAVTPPSNTFSLSCSPLASSGFYEIGTCICICGCGTFNQGCINPQYTSVCDRRSGAPNTYVYWSNCYGNACHSCSALSDCYCYTTHQITALTESYCGCVCYDHGCPVLNSCGGTYCSALPAGSTSAIGVSISALYPYFWGVSSSAPTAGQTLLNGGNKIISPSTGSITINFNVNTPSKYLWFAIPTTSGIKTKWFGSNAPSTNTEPIPGGLFPAKITCIGMNSPTALWSNQSYDFYISNYATSTYSSGTPYTITFTP